MPCAAYAARIHRSARVCLSLTNQKQTWKHDVLAARWVCPLNCTIGFTDTLAVDVHRSIRRRTAWHNLDHLSELTLIPSTSFIGPENNVNGSHTDHLSFLLSFYLAWSYIFATKTGYNKCTKQVVSGTTTFPSSVQPESVFPLNLPLYDDIFWSLG